MNIHDTRKVLKKLPIYKIAHDSFDLSMMMSILKAYRGGGFVLLELNVGGFNVSMVNRHIRLI